VGLKINTSKTKEIRISASIENKLTIGRKDVEKMSFLYLKCGHYFGQGRGRCKELC
jgi:hypothetical protein